MTVNEIIAEVKQNAALLRKNDTASVEIVIKQARLLVHLHSQARAKTWEKTCEKDLEISARYARRYLKIGEKWATDETSPTTELYEKLPYDVQKLEFLCELSLNQLKKICVKHDLRKLDRGEVMLKVNAELGKAAAAKPAVTASKMLDRWDTFVDGFEEEISKLDTDGRSEVASQLEELLEQLRISLERATSSTTDAKDEAAEDMEQEPDDEEGADDDLPQDEDDSQGEKEVPEQKTAPASKGGQSGSRRPAKPQTA